MGAAQVSSRPMTAAKSKSDENFLAMLEKGVKDILRNKDATNPEKLSAINAGAKLLQIRNKITDDNETGFFTK